jgi:(2Fe-2S) ferredoxin
MARTKLPRYVKPGPSNGAADKMYACLNYLEGKWPGQAYVKAPFYFAACFAWYNALSWEQQMRVADVVSAFTDRGERVAQSIAKTLPPAPRFPF